MNNENPDHVNSAACETNDVVATAGRSRKRLRHAFSGPTLALVLLLTGSTLLGGYLPGAAAANVPSSNAAPSTASATPIAPSAEINSAVWHDYPHLSIPLPPGVSRPGTAGPHPQLLPKITYVRTANVRNGAEADQATGGPLASVSQPHTIINGTYGWNGIWSGSPNPCGCYPPDTNNGAGNGYVAETVNAYYEVWSTTGTVVLSEAQTTFWGITCTSFYCLSDPEVYYDPLTGHWIQTEIDLRNYPSSCSPSCPIDLAVSVNGDPTGTWKFYALNDPAGILPDQPQLGANGLNIAVNDNDFGSGTAHIWLVNETQADAGAASPSEWDSTGPGNLGDGSLHAVRSVSPSDTQYFVGDNFGGVVTLNIVAVRGSPPTLGAVTWTNLSTSTGTVGCLTVPGGGGMCQIDGRVNAGAWRNGILWAAAPDGCGTGNCLHFWEITTSTMTMTSDFTWTPTGETSYFPNLAIGAGGGIGVVFSFSSSTTYPSVGVTARTPGDPPGTLETPLFVKPGGAVGSATGRYGDYSGAAYDESTTNFWVSGEYIQGGAGAADWETWVQSFMLPGFIALGAITPNPVDVTVPVNFNGTYFGGSGPFTFKWVYGDGSVGSAARNPVHVYNATGSFSPHFWVNETTGMLRSREANFSVTVNSLPVPSFSATPSPTDVGINSTFTSAVTGGTSPFTYAWSFGDGFQSTSASPVHQYSAAGTYTVKLWVNDSGGGSGLISGSILVNPQPSITFSATPVPVDAGVGVALSSSTAGGTGLVNVSWVLGDGSVATGGTLVHTYPVRGNYTVRAWANDSIGGTGNATQLIVVNPYLALLLVSASPLALDAGRSVTFGASYWGGTAGYTYTWRFGDGTSSATLAPVHAFATAGSPIVRFWLNDSGGGSAVAQVPITVNPALTITSFQGAWTGTARNALDKGQTLSLSAIVTGGTGTDTYVYSGLPGGCTSWNFASLSCAPNQTGNFSVELKVTDQNGVSAFSNTTFVVNPPLAVSAFSASPAIDTVNGPTTLTVAASHGTPGYRYSFPVLPSGCSASTNASVSCVPTTAGTNSAEVRVTDAAGVNAFANTTFLVNPSPQVLSFVATPGTVTVGDLVSFQVSASGGTAPYSYAYTGLPGGCSLSGNGGSCHPSSTGTFKVQVTVTDSNGQKATATTTVTVNAPAGIFAGGLYSFGFLWTLLALLAIVVLVFLILVLRRFRGPKGQASTYSPGTGTASTAYESTDHSVAPSPEGHTFPSEPAPAPPSTQPGFAPPPPPPPESSTSPPPPPPPPSSGGGMGGWPQ